MSELDKVLKRYYDEDKRQLSFKMISNGSKDGTESMSVKGSDKELVIRIKGDMLRGDDKRQSTSFHHLSNIANHVDSLQDLVFFLDSITGVYWDEEASWEESEGQTTKILKND